MDSLDSTNQHELCVTLLIASPCTVEHNDPLTKEPPMPQTGTASMFMALVEPAEPVKVSFPLSDEDRLKFSAARDGLMQSVRKQSTSMDTKKEDTKAELRTKTTDNQEKTLAILLKAVKGGMTVQEARMGMVIAQFEKLSDQEKEEAMKKATIRQVGCPLPKISKSCVKSLNPNPY